MSADKTVTILGFLAKAEASYNAGASLSTATDGIQVAEFIEMTPGYADEGKRSAPPGTLGHQRKVAPSGRTASFTAKVEPKGAGAPYSSSVVPNVHTLLKGAGFDATGSFTGGSEKWTYTPTAGPVSFTSLAASLYARGELYPVTGIYSDFLISADGPTVPIAEFAMQGLMTAAITDIAVPAITYPLSTIDPPKSVGAGLLTIGNATGLKLRKWSIKLGREIAPRLNQNTAAGHAGFGIGKRTPVLEVTYESPALATTPFTAASTIDPYSLFEAATNVAVAVQVGATQYNKHKYSCAQAQIMSAPQLSADGPTALTTLQFQLNPSVLGANDELTILFD